MTSRPICRHDGRTVRCAKCGTVWRAMPDSGGEEVEDNLSSWVAPSGESEEYRDEARAGQTAQDHFAAAGSDEERNWSSNQDAVASQEETVAEEETRFQAEAGEPDPESEADEANTTEENENTGKVSWFSSFRRRKKLKQKGRRPGTHCRSPPQRQYRFRALICPLRSNQRKQ